MKWTATEIAKWINETRFRFPGWGAWLIGHEPNTPEPEAYENAAYRILIFRLSPYTDVASSMSHGLLGQLSLSVPGVYVDYGFMPPSQEGEAMIRAGIPPLFGTTSRRPFQDFNMVAFSNAISQELVNLPWLLKHSGIPMDFRKRTNDSSMPLLFMGGANAQSAFAACPSDGTAHLSFVDAIYFGEAEVSWPGLLDDLKAMKQAGTGKTEIWQETERRFSSLHIAHSEAFKKRENARLNSLNDIRSLVQGPVWYEEETLGESSVLIDAGCPHLCAFCKEAWERRPYRLRPVDRIVADIDAARKFQGLDRVNLFSFSLTSHPEIARIITSAQSHIAHVSMKSQRFDQLVKNPDLLLYQQAAGKTSFTFGLEGVSERIRRFLSKSIFENQVLEALAMIFAGPLRQVKFFIILTGYETSADWEECQSLFQKISDLRKKSITGRKAPLVLSVMPLIPMPHTPMQFNPFPERKHIEQGMHHLKQIAHLQHMTVRESISYSEAKIAHLFLFADGGETEAISGCTSIGTYHHHISERIITGIERKLDQKWKSWVLGEKHLEDRFPWDSLYTAKEKEKLFSIYSRLKSTNTSSMNTSVKSTGAAKVRPKINRIPVSDTVYTHWFSVDAGPQLAGVPIRFFQVALARVLMMASADLNQAYLRPGPSIADVEAIPTYGLRIFSLIFRKPVKEFLEEILSEISPKWGWTLTGNTAKPFSAVSGNAILEISAGNDWLEKSLRNLTDQLATKSIGYQIKKRPSIQTLLIEKSYSKKTGFDFACWDKGNSIFRWAITDGKCAEGFLRKARIPLPWETKGHAFRTIARMNPHSEITCPECHRPVWVNAMDGSDFAELSCRSLCSESSTKW
ncbi:MAG: radical SAM protein [Proteobacteria bacterium]|nr:radical SAM protein [Pseudomonadota bacterium]